MPPKFPRTVVNEYPERCVMMVPSRATHYPRTLAVMLFPFRVRRTGNLPPSAVESP